MLYLLFRLDLLNITSIFIAFKIFITIYFNVMITFKLFSDGYIYIYIYCTDFKKWCSKKLFFFCTSRFLIAILDFVKERIIKKLRNYFKVDVHSINIIYRNKHLLHHCLWHGFVHSRTWTYPNGHRIFSHCYSIKCIMWGCTT